MAGIKNAYHTATYLLKLISEQKLDPSDLSKHQRRVCIRYLIMECKHSQHEIAAILRISQPGVAYHYKRIQQENQWIIDEFDERQAAVALIMEADVASRRLYRKGKEWEAWQVRRGFIETMQALGYIKHVPRKIKFEGGEEPLKVEINASAKLTMQEILLLAAGKDENVLGNAGAGAAAAPNGGPP